MKGHTEDGTTSKEGPSAGKKISKLLCELSDDDESELESDATPAVGNQSDPHKPWLQDFNQYMHSSEQLAEDQTIVEWWGVSRFVISPLSSSSLTLQMNATCFGPVWASLAWDYLPIMASSVSSEQAFLSAGITITKHQNQLKGNVVEALQVMKCLLQSDLIFWEQGPSSLVEQEPEDKEEVVDEELTWVGDTDVAIMGLTTGPGNTDVEI